MRSNGGGAGVIDMLTLDVIRAEHGRLLELGAGTLLSLPDYLRQVRMFVEALTDSGVYFDEPAERRALQSYLDHWTGELAHNAAAEERIDVTHLEIKPFDAKALGALQDKFANPFQSLVAEVAALPEETRKSPTGVLKLLEEKAKAARLRFQNGMLKEMAAQVANDPEGATLLEFCLWHLFEDRATRTGNKISRPQGEQTFSCTAYLVDKAAQLHAAQAEREQAALMNALLSFGGGSDAETRRAMTRTAIARLRDRASRGFALYASQSLDLEQFLVRSRLAFDNGSAGLVLVHQVLPRQWVQLATGVAARNERMRTRLQGAFLLVGLAALAGALFWAQTMWRAQRSEDALRYASSAASEGAIASAHIWTYTLAFDTFPYQDENEFKQRLRDVLAPARSHYENQLEYRLRALSASDSPDARRGLNDAIASSIGFLGQIDGFGELPPYPIVVFPSPSSGADPLARKCADQHGTFCLALGRELLAISGASPRDLQSTPIVNHDGTRLAMLATPQAGGALTVFAVGKPATQGADAAQAQTALLTLKQSAVRGCAPSGDWRMRFVPGSDILTLECIDRKSADYGKWLYFDFAKTDRIGGLRSVPGLASAQQLESSDKGRTCHLVLETEEGTKESTEETLPTEGASVFLATSTHAGDPDYVVTAGRNGYVRLWPNQDPAPPCPRTQFFSDFVRMVTVGEPAAIAFYHGRASNLYAVYHDSPPVIRVFRQRDPAIAEQVMEQYAPFGLGTPVAISFTRKGQCLEIQAIRKKPLTPRLDAYPVRITYYLVLGRKALLTLGSALKADLDEAGLKDARNYRKAVAAQCDVAQP